MTGGRLRAIRRLAKQVLNGARLIAGLMLGLPLRLLAPFYRIEVQRIWGERVGHLALEPELLLSQREGKPIERTLTLFFNSRPVANQFMLQMWQRKLPTGPSWLLGPIYEANKRWPWLDTGARGWDEQHFDLRSLDEVSPHVTFTREESDRGKRLLEELGVPEGMPFVCLAVRDSAYLAATDPSKDWTYHNYRDSDISTYVAMAKFLTEAGYAVLRMGAVVNEPLKANSPLVIDYATSGLRSDFGDVFLFAHCAFCISTSTGMDALAMLFRRPLGITNLASTGGMQIGGPLVLIMCKDYADLETGQALSLDCDKRVSAMRLFRTQDLTALGVRVIDNSPDELVDFAREMVAVTSGTLDEDPLVLARGKELIQRLHPDSRIRESSFLLSPAWLRTRLRDESARSSRQSPDDH